MPIPYLAPYIPEPRSSKTNTLKGFVSEQPNDQMAVNGPIAGRFAPSPTGELHLGSLATALASYCHIKSLEGNWLLRIEDTDLQRCDPKFTKKILIDLDRLGLHWDGDIGYQSQRTEIYNEQLLTYLKPRIYGCHCSRKQLHGYDVYPRFCLPDRPLSPDNTKDSNLTQSQFQSQPQPLCPSNVSSLEGKKVRVQLPDFTIGFLDGIQGMQMTNPQRTLGDVVLRRADGIINYFLAVSIDDGLQGITHVMRGLDILPLTTAQIAIMTYLKLPAVAHWYHLPLVENQFGQKLSKQNLATPIDTSTPEKCQLLIHQTLALLKQPKVDTDLPAVMLSQAVIQWQHTSLQHHTSLGKV